MQRRGTIACTRARESGGFEIENLLRVPGDAYRSSSLLAWNVGLIFYARPFDVAA